MYWLVLSAPGVAGFVQPPVVAHGGMQLVLERLDRVEVGVELGLLVAAERRLQAR